MKLNTHKPIQWGPFANHVELNINCCNKALDINKMGK